jgi:hypothetical protein
MLYNRGQQMGAMALLVLLILVFLFYGLRWFPGGNLNGTKGKVVTWPPIVNMCPDFMVSWTAPDSKLYCYDAANIYGLQNLGNAPPLMSGLTIDKASNQNAYLIKDPSDAASTSTLGSKLTKDSNAVLTNDAKYLRWEGVWDGQTKTVANIPNP